MTIVNCELVVKSENIMVTHSNVSCYCQLSELMAFRLDQFSLAHTLTHMPPINAGNNNTSNTYSFKEKLQTKQMHDSEPQHLV